MELSQEYIQRFSKPVKPRVHTAEQALADEIYSHFSKRLPFPRIMSMIKRKGRQFIYEIFNLIKDEKVKDQLSLFIWKVEKENR